MLEALLGACSSQLRAMVINSAILLLHARFVIRLPTYWSHSSLLSRAPVSHNHHSASSTVSHHSPLTLQPSPFLSGITRYSFSPGNHSLLQILLPSFANFV